MNWFENFFKPQVKKLYSPGDVILCLGDLFDNTTSVNIKAINIAVNWWSWFEEQNMDSILLVGNHDMFGESSKEYTSTNLLKNFSRLKIISRAEKIIYDDIVCAFMAYERNLSVQRSILQELTPAKYLFCHTDLLGCRIRPKTQYDKGELDHGMDISEFVAFDSIWSGHIHLRQDIGNFRYVGCPYHQDKRDVGDKKGIWTLEPSSGKSEFIPNNYSPEYRIIHVNNEDDLNVDNSHGDWIELVIKNSLLHNKTIYKKIELLSQQGKIVKTSYIDDTKIEEVIKKEVKENPNVDIRSAMINSINNQKLPDSHTKIFETLLDKIFDKHQKEFK
jgi:DNA repair exonuclease SbcCD nuclease subunit